MAKSRIIKKHRPHPGMPEEKMSARIQASGRHRLPFGVSH
jgi:hypothetical protein